MTMPADKLVSIRYYDYVPMTRVSAIDLNTVEPRPGTAVSDTVAASSLIDRAGRMVHRLRYADELNSAQGERLRFLVATVLAADDTDRLHIDFIGCERE